MKNNDHVILVDDLDREKGTMDKLEAHKLGLLHRAFSVFIFNSKGQILLQKRAKHKYHSAGLWTNTCCSHPKPGESIYDAAERRLMEEMGIQCPIKKIFEFTYQVSFENGLIEHELDHVFIGRYEGNPEINKEEADEWKYEFPEIVLEELNKNPEQFTEWFKICFHRVYEFVKVKMKITDPVSVYWFRRDLRIEDNTGLFHALNNHFPVIPIFIYDTEILNDLKNDDPRVEFIHTSVEKIKAEFNKHKGSIYTFNGKPIEILESLISQWNVQALYFNSDYEPYAIQRDTKVAELFLKNGIPVYRFKDHVIFETEEILKEDKTPYTVYTPYMKKWKKTLQNEQLKTFDSKKILKNLYKVKENETHSLKSLNFKKSHIKIPELKIDKKLIQDYHKTRDFPAIAGTTRLGIHLRFGTVSTRLLIKTALELNETWLNELIWREFFQMIIYHFPYSANNSFKREYDNINWIYDEKLFSAWCNGKTGYPMVDAGMRELNETGFMHNRVRMVTASFLSKHLLIDWRWGEAYFAEKLLDYELASNVGNWQWAAGCGCDAAPYFRIFNPDRQQERFDPKFEYIKKWVPEFESDTYTKPIIDHKFARERALKVYKEGISAK